MILLHGIGTSAAAWDRVRGVLAARGLETHAPELAGISLAAPGRRDSPSSIRDLAATVAQELSDRADPFVLVGHSLGAAVALAVAEALPACCLGVVLVNPVGERTRLPAPAWVAEAMLRTLDAAPLALSAGTALAKTAFKPSASGSTGLNPLLFSLKGVKGVVKGLQLVQWLPSNWSEAHLGNTPVLLLIGNRDPLLLLHSNQHWRNLSSDFSCELILGGGHSPHITHHVQVAGAITRFYERIGK